MWSKIRDLIRSKTENAIDYDGKYMKIKFHLDHELPLNKTITAPSMIIGVFHENKNDECLYKL